MAQGEDITEFTEPHEENEPIGRVQNGMKVVDSTGDDIGKVSFVKMGDPQAVTDAGEYSESGVMGATPAAYESAGAVEGGTAGGPALGAVWGGENFPDVPPTIAARLLREGYIKINGPFLIGKDRYAPAWTIDRVEGDTVYLSVPKDDLPQAR